MAEEVTPQNKTNWFSPTYLVIYAVVGLVVLAGLLVVGKKLKNKMVGDDASMVVPAPAPAQPAPAAMAPKEWKISLAPQNGSKEDGTAVLSDENGKTKVVVTVSNEPTGTPQPAHIHVGACPTPGAVKYPLTNVVNGTSQTVLDVKLDDLKTMLPLAVNVHKSAEEVKVYTACGNLK